MGMDKLMQFRTIYLRAVAEAWANPDFHKQLLEHPVHALRDFFGFKWPWSHICNLKIDESNRFMWIGNEWVWAPCQGESLTLFVPLEPRGIEPKHRAMALGDFYRQSSSIFSDDWGQPFGPDGPSAPGTASASAPSGAAGLLGGALGPDSGPPPGGFVPGSAVFASFDVVLLAAMARAWEDSDYRTKLLLDTATALHEIREYALPWKLLPEKPRDIAVEPLALASYNAMGAQYPFTCCCFDD